MSRTRRAAFIAGEIGATLGIAAVVYVVAYGICVSHFVGACLAGFAGSLAAVTPTRRRDAAPR